MKKHLLIISAFAFVFGWQAAHAQIINPGFETWSPNMAVPTANDPNSGNASTGWWDYNLFNYAAVGASPISVFQCDTAHSGSYSARIETVIYTPASYTYDAPWGVPFIGHNYLDTLGILFNGNVNELTTTFIPGIPCNQNLTQFSFYYKYKPHGVDTAECRVLLVNHRQAVAGGLVKINTASSTWQQATITFVSVSSLVPDTLYVLFSSSSLDRKPQPGSVLWVDDVSVVGSAGINQLLSAESHVDVFPNPASNSVNFNITGLNNTATTLSIFDITGKKINSVAVHNNLTTINTQVYNNGLYFYQLNDNEGNLIKSDKFSIVK